VGDYPTGTPAAEFGQYPRTLPDRGDPYYMKLWNQRSRQLPKGEHHGGQLRNVVNDLFAAWTRLNLDEVMGHFAEDAVWDNVPMPTAQGSAAIREMTHSFMKDASAFSVKILKTVHDGNVVFNERVDTIVMKNGKKADIRVAGMFEFNEVGKIKVWRDYFDLTTFTKQIS
jgi:limonene-1,2-epoxide hydrolase